ncbi:MAG TPA: ferritin-like domain-containing protein [Longimicrobiales bacterium]|nr:ferritin-like domain-containing protein [Longimicrobiales bacterium]
MNEAVRLLQEARARERAQALFYRFLAGNAEIEGRPAVAERLNDLLADEQHHVSRVTARLLELGERPGEMVDAPEVPSLDAWEVAARLREEDEVRWYEHAVGVVEDDETRSVFAEILASERHHRDELAGKWMSAEKPPTRKEP